MAPAEGDRHAGITDMQNTKFEARSLGLQKMDPAKAAAMPKMISADSHVMEPDALWKQLPKELQAKLPPLRFGTTPPGAGDPKLRRADQIEDGVQAEVLFPNYGMALFGVDDIDLQVEGFKLYNDWVADFCKASPKNFFATPCISVYDIDAAVKEMHRGHDMGLIGCMVWQVPDPKLSFMSQHYDKLWAAAAEANAPVVCHILTGHSYTKTMHKVVGAERIRNSVNKKTDDTVNTLFDFIFGGAFDRHPKLKLLLAESEVGFLPFMLQQWDYYYERFRRTDKMPISRPPSEIFAEHVYGTFLEDFAGTRNFPWWGEQNCMWSNDYPHFNMTYPYSRENVEKHLAGLSDQQRMRLTRDNVIELFGLKDRL